MKALEKDGSEKKGTIETWAREERKASRQYLLLIIALLALFAIVSDLFSKTSP